MTALENPTLADTKKKSITQQIATTEKRIVSFYKRWVNYRDKVAVTQETITQIKEDNPGISTDIKTETPTTTPAPNLVGDTPVVDQPNQSTTTTVTSTIETGVQTPGTNAPSNTNITTSTTTQTQSTLTIQ